jgi:hypothetical protein
MEKIIEELHTVVRLKETTEPGDIVVVLAEDPQSLVYARVVGFERDMNKREEWWHITMYILNVPPQKVVWTLRTPQFTGQEIFTMGGKKHYVKALDFSEPDEEAPVKNVARKKDKKPGLRVVK